MKICIEICSGREWRAIKDILNIDNERISKGPLGEYFSASIDKKEFLFQHSGPTKTRAAACCQLIIDKWQPDLIVNIGSCGGVSKKLKCFDIILAAKTVQYDCHDFMDGKNQIFYEPMVTELDNSWLKLDKIAEPLYQGIIGTADQDLTYQTAFELRKNEVLAVDWESGAIAKICELNNTKCLILRGITDIPVNGHDSNKTRQTNGYKKNTYGVMKKLLNCLTGLQA